MILYGHPLKYNEAVGMDYVRQVLDSGKLYEILDLPASLRGRKVEIIVLPVGEEAGIPVKSGSAFGCLHKYANPDLIPFESGAWEAAVTAKHGYCPQFDIL